MHSIRTKITLLNIVAVSISITIATVIGAISIADFSHERVEKEMALLCETGVNNINNYLKSIEQSINTVSSLIDEKLNEIPDDDFANQFYSQVEASKIGFYEIAKNTAGVLTYYYRIDPSISEVTNENGYWFTNLDGKGFVEHEVTDLSDNQFECIWFYTPKATGEPVWLSPYVTDNLDVYVISYNVPVYRGEKKQFIGVVGIELSYTILWKQVESIKALSSGYTYIIENERQSIICHPTLDVIKMKEEDRPLTPPEFIEAYKKGEHHIVYSFDGVLKHSVWLPLSNDMSVVVAAPLNEVNQVWITMVIIVVSAGIAIIVIFALITTFTVRKITKPLKYLTKAAEEIDNGNYDVKLYYNGNDEIGTLTNTFNTLIDDLKIYIAELNSLAYADSLTKVSNKSAYMLYTEELQKKIDCGEEKVEFAIAILDCDNLKDINDKFGHDKGDIYIRSACHLMCSIFENSKVYRVGGDEFAIIIEGEDYINRAKLEKTFIEMSMEISSLSKNPWEKINVSIGIADYDPQIDDTVNDVMIDADHRMYINKRSRKRNNK